MRSIWSVLAVLLLATAPAAAEWRSPITGNAWKQPYAPAFEPMLVSDALQRRIAAAVLRARGMKLSPAAPAKHVAASASDFKSTKGRPYVSKVLLSMFEDPKGTQLLPAVRKSIDEWETVSAFRKNNVAAALGLAIYAALLRQKVTMTDTELKELILAANDHLATRPEFVKLSAPQKQALYEMFLTTSSMIVLFGVTADDDPTDENSKAIAAELAAQVLATVGYDPRK
ncbi:MAG: hypothetical protein H0T46_19125 [Deltaproteobacteria bacterium]|nr:hypothetical protein [Deltaproteobacteria bacterium]